MEVPLTADSVTDPAAQAANRPGQNPATVFYAASTLLNPTERKLHAARAVLRGKKILSTCSTAVELRSEPYWRTPGEGAWWTKQWNDPGSPYRIATPSDEQDELAERIRREIPEGCCPGIYLDDLRCRINLEASAIIEGMALGGKTLHRSWMRTIDVVELNRWAARRAPEWGLEPKSVLHDVDMASLAQTEEPQDLKEWMRAALMAFWPDDSDDPLDVLQQAWHDLDEMARGKRKSLRQTACRILNGLEFHSDPLALVESVRGRRVTRERAPADIPATRRESTVERFKGLSS